MIGGLRGRTALLTGATGGLGRHLARALAAEGVDLALSARNATALDNLAGELRAIGVKAHSVVADLSDPAAAAGLVGEAQALIGPIDILVNNAGVELVSFYSATSAEDIRAILEVNLHAPMLLTRDILPGMLKRGRGHIVNISSLSGKVPPSCSAAYAATKAGLIALTQSLRAEHAGQPVGISVICPGFITGDGMYGRLVAEGLTVPPTVGAASPERVTKAVLDAIARDMPERVVSARPIRPLIALGAIAPRAAERMLAMSGLHDYFQRIAARQCAPDDVNGTRSAASLSRTTHNEG